MNCVQLRQSMSQYLDGDLTPARSAEVRDHLAACAACTAGLETLRAAVRVMEASAGAHEMDEDADLYDAFRQRLAARQSGRRTMRAALPAWSRLALAGAGCALLALYLLLPHGQASRALAAIDAALRRPWEGPIHMVAVTHGTGPNWFGGTITTETWSKDEWRLEKASSTESTRSFVGPDGRPIVERVYKPKTSYALFLPGEVSLQWEQGQPEARLYWQTASSPRLQGGAEQEQAQGLQATARSLRTLVSLLQAGGRATNADIETGKASVDGEPLTRISMRNIRMGWVSSLGGLGAGSPQVPRDLIVWLDQAGRLRRVEEAYVYPKGGSSRTETRFEYPDKLPAGVPELPGGRASEARWYERTPVQPVWLTMDEAEREQVRQAALPVVRAWAEHDERLLRKLIDMPRYVQLVNGGGRGKLSPDAAWQTVWHRRLASEPGLVPGSVEVVFGFAVADDRSATVPNAFWDQTPGATLPGLNALAWVTGTGPNGKSQAFPLRLFLVRRGDTWRVYLLYSELPGM